jgi:hypothetical protein
MKIYKLENGREIGIKKLGAYSQAKVIDRIFSLASGIRLDSVMAGDPAIFIELLRRLLGSEFEKTAELITWISMLNIEELQADGDEAISLDDLIGIFQTSYEYNQFDKPLQRLKNVPMPANQPAGDNGNGSRNLAPNSSTSSPNPIDGESLNSTKSALMMHSP